MFSYYGGKSKIVKFYPEPRFNTIIEPFAGAANYALAHSLFHPNRYRVILVEKSLDVFLCWKWLQSASASDLINLPLAGAKDDIPSVEPRGAQVFLSFLLNQGTARPRHKVGSVNGCRLPNVKAKLSRMAENLNVVRDWEIIHGDYTQAPNIEATYYVDPPYCKERWNEYKHGAKELNFDALGIWCYSRQGQVIVCENSDSTWLPFVPLCRALGQRANTSKLLHEGIWTQ